MSLPRCIAACLLPVAIAWLVSGCGEERHIPVSTDPRPDIIWIVADDLGIADIGDALDERIRFPNLEKLRQRGIEFTQARATSSICTPARAGLLSGRSPQQAGMGQNVRTQAPEGVDIDTFGLDPQERLLPRTLSEAGYRTGIVGKWHLGLGEGAHPLAQGFESFYGFLSGGRTYLRRREVDDESSMQRDYDYVDEVDSVTDALGVGAAEFLLEEHERPVFLYLSFNAPHVPLEPLPRDLQRIPEDLDPDRRAYFGLMVAVDRAVGRLMESVKARGRGRNTMIVFTSDHGGKPANGASNGDLRSGKGTLFEGGLAVPMFVSWPAELPRGEQRADLVSHLDLAATAAAGALGSVPEDLEGLDLVQATSEELKARTLYWRYYGVGAVRRGDWKLFGSAGEAVSLYHLGRDPLEKQDLLAGEAAIGEDLLGLLNAWDAQLPDPRWRISPTQQKASRRVHSPDFFRAPKKRPKQAR